MKRIWPAAAVTLAFFIGYYWPRELEIESTKPIVLHYEITPEAARILVFKYVEDRGENP